MIDEPNGNNLLKHPNGLASSFSNDDMSQSQSISEYTDANESMSCPTEFLAEVNNNLFQLPLICSLQCTVYESN